MNAIVIEHVPVGALPAEWRAKLKQAADALVTIRIETEAAPVDAARPNVSDNPLFGMWRDREDMADVAGYVRAIRASRFSDDGFRRD